MADSASRPNSMPPEVLADRDASAVNIPPQVAHYRLVRRLGRGGMGVVYEGVHLHLKRRVAIKLLLDAAQAGSGRLRRFEREMEAIGRLHHRHIVQAHDAGCDNGLHYLVMEYIDGCDLQASVRHLGRLSVPAACGCIRQAALGLDYAHAHSCIHRDIKPSNLLFDSQGIVRVADLGLARLQTAPSEYGLTMSGQVLGTIDYMSPEQARGERDIGPASDIYSLGCTLYYLLAGQVPYYGPQYDSLARKLMAHVEEPLPPLAEQRDDVPPEVIELLTAMTAKEPSQRPTAAEVAQRLEPLAADEELVTLAATLSELRQHRDDDASISRDTPTAEVAPGSTDQAINTGSTLPSVASNAPKRSVRWGMSLVMLGLGGMIAVATVVWWPVKDELTRPGAMNHSGQPLAAASHVELPPQPQLPPREPYFEELTADQLQPNVVYPLLNVEPETLFWGNNPLARVSFEPGLKQVTATNPDVGLVLFGSAPRVGYTLQMDIYQNRWPAGIGVFFGLRPLDEPGPNGERQWKVQVLYLQERIVGPKIGEFPLEMIRSERTIRALPNGHISHVTTDLCSVWLSNPGIREQQLELTVGPKGLNAVRWGGNAEVARDLCLFDVNSRFGEQDYCGGFGAYLFNSEGIFRNVRIQFHPPRDVPP